jgi:hypothetical protein
MGSGILPSSADESQLSQQIDIATPLIPQRSIPLPPAPVQPTCLPPIRSINNDKTEPVFIPITNNINHDNESDAPVMITKRISTLSTGLTENQKEKLRTRHAIPLLCDDNSNTQSLCYTFDSPTIENMMATYQLRRASTGNKQSTTENTSLFKQQTSDSSPSIQSSPSQENNTAGESSSSPPASSSSITTENPNSSNENLSEQTSNSNHDEDIPEESSITKKLRRSRRPSTSARKSLTNNARKKRLIPLTDELTTMTTVVPSIVVDPPSEVIKNRPLKSILKRLSPTNPRQDHTRHVAFHDQVKVLLFASPLRRDLSSQQQKKKSPTRDDIQSSSVSTRRLSKITNHEQSSIINNNKTRTSKLFTLSDSTCEVIRKELHTLFFQDIHSFIQL